VTLAAAMRKCTAS